MSRKRRALKSWAIPVAYLAAPVTPGDEVIRLDRAIEATEGLRLGDPDARSYETVGVEPGQEFPASVVRMQGRPRYAYSAGEPVSAVKDW